MHPLFKFITTLNARRKFAFTMFVAILFVTKTHYTALFGDLPHRNLANSIDSFHFAEPNTAFVSDQVNHDVAAAIDKSIASFRSDNDPENNRSNDNAEARWVSMPNVAPYFGNDICPFESWDGVLMYGKVKSSKLSDKIQHCSSLKYTPYKGYEAPDPELIFEYLPHGATITIVGDSISRQASLDFACKLFAISSVSKEAEEKAGNHSREVTFTSPDGKKNIVLKYLGCTDLKQMIPSLQGANRGDVFIMNQGAHFLGRYEYKVGYEVEELIDTLKELEPMFKEVMGRGVLVAWRETNAAKFTSKDGYWNEIIGDKQSKNIPVRCVNPEELDVSASFSRVNAIVNPVVESIGVPILDFWKSSVLLPTSCYKEEKGDCLHFMPPGGTSYITENVLNFIYSSLVNISVE